ncbi:MAG: type II secretion system F family protein [Nitrospirales bacterium]|nr:type II secretion system F family protein [Nitrospira sp.]MDR4501787.1 type II secretion system F family protein [Nitrospirales bacterium]
MTILISIGIFVSIILLIEGGFHTYYTYLSPKNKKIKRRLRASGKPKADSDSSQQANIVRKRATGNFEWLNQLLAKVTSLSAIELLLIQANSHMPLSVFVLASLVSASFAGLAAIIYNLGMLGMLGCGAVGIFLPYGYMRWKRSSRFLMFQQQLPDALDLMARALRAGHAFSVGMKMVGDEFPDPIGPEMGRAVEEISYGIEIPEALKSLSKRIECVDLKFFVTALIVQRETGGNLAEIIEAISRLIRLRFELLGRVQALSAEGKWSAIVLMALPIVLLFGLSWINPAYMDPLYSDPTGQMMLGVALVWMTIGGVVIKRMINIKT